jgi:hypothetical protein
MTAIIATTVQWVILPSIMMAIFACALVVAGTARSPELKVSSWAGLGAGLLTFVIYVVSQLSRIREPNLHFAALPGLLLLPLGWGLAAGFLFLWMVRYAVRTRLVGIITLMLSASSTSAMFTYVFLDSMRVEVLYWTLGTSLGIFLHVVFFPASVEHIVRTAARPGPSAGDIGRNPSPEFLSPAGLRRPDSDGSGQGPYESETPWSSDQPMPSGPAHVS